VSDKKINKNIIYAIVGIVAITIIVTIFTSGSESTVSPTLSKALTMGQAYTLDNPNEGDILLVRTPGFGTREDDSKESENVCVVESNTPVIVEQETVINYMHFVKVKPTSGDCAGKAGWTAKINIK
jgi:hypothetical protein